MIGVAASVLLAGWVATLAAKARRRRCLNEALHELRRPLQQLALHGVAGGGGAAPTAWIEQASRALSELDSLINGGERIVITPERFSIGELLGSCRERWLEGRPVRFEVADPEAPMLGDRRGVGAALDNLIANAIEHGRGPVLVRGSRTDGALTLSVSNDAKRFQPSREGWTPRRGHGLRIAERIALEQGGRLEPRLARGDTVVARLVLPVAAPASGARGS